MDKGHGRVEKRTLEVTTWLAEYLGPDWPGCAGVPPGAQRRAGGEVEVEVAFGITSLPRGRAAAKELLALTRAHWGIENGLHGRRDGALREDAGRVRTGSAPQVVAALRNLVIFLRRASGAPRSRRLHATICATPRSRSNSCQARSDNETALRPRGSGHYC